MATVGLLGNVVFSVSQRKIRTYNNLQVTKSARYAKHNRHLKKTLLEFQGVDADTMTFVILLSVYLGTNPDQEMSQLAEYLEKGVAVRLVLGNRVEGSYKWVITKLGESRERFDKRGRLLASKITVTLEEYVRS